MRFRVAVRKLNVTDGWTDERTGGGGGATNMVRSLSSQPL